MQKATGFSRLRFRGKNGLELYIDGRRTDIIRVNKAFAGAHIEKGTHKIEFRFSPPGKQIGCIISLISLLCYLSYLILHLESLLQEKHKILQRLTIKTRCKKFTIIIIRKRELTLKRIYLSKELLTYIITGGITTGVNYMLYGLFSNFFHVPYIASNSIAWTGAVIAAYVLNRKWVFRSNRRIPEEFFSFAALRFITLLVENVLLWLAVDQLSLSLIGSKLIVSVVTVIGNYALCKYRVFKTAAHGQDQNMIRKELLPYDNQK